MYGLFGDLDFGEFFKYRGSVWVKVPLTETKGKEFNAYTAKIGWWHSRLGRRRVVVNVFATDTLVSLNTGTAKEIVEKSKNVFRHLNEGGTDGY